MAEGLQEQLLRGHVEIPKIEKPWTAPLREKLVGEYQALGLTESFLSVQLRGIQQRRTELRSLIVESYTDGSEDPYITAMNGPYVQEKAKTEEIKLPVAIPGQESIHFQKPYQV